MATEPPTSRANAVEQLNRDGNAPAARAIAFPEEDGQEEKPTGGLRSKGVEMKRTLTQEERDLAAAGYDHLETKGSSRESQLSGVDIQEHRLPLEQLASELGTSLELKDPSASHGLTSTEAKLRLTRDGPNMLSPPKKKSALRKVWMSFLPVVISLMIS